MCDTRGDLSSGIFVGKNTNWNNITSFKGISFAVPCAAKHGSLLCLDKKLRQRLSLVNNAYLVWFNPTFDGYFLPSNLVYQSHKQFWTYTLKKHQPSYGCWTGFLSNIFIGYGICYWLATITQFSNKPSFYFSHQYLPAADIEKEALEIPPKGAAPFLGIKYVLGSLNLNKLYRRQEKY